MASYVPRRPRCCLMTSSVLVFLVVYVNSMCVPPAAASASFEFNAYCQKLCLWGRGGDGRLCRVMWFVLGEDIWRGRGGNLCRCNAVHFVGKRRVTTSLFQAAAGRANVDGPSSRSQQQLSLPETGTKFDVFQVEDEQPDLIRHDDDAYTELDEDGSGAINSAAVSGRSAAAGSDDKATGSRLNNGSRAVDQDSAVHVDTVDQSETAGEPSAEIDVDLVEDFQREPVIVFSDDYDNDGLVAAAATDVTSAAGAGSDGATEFNDAIDGEKAKRGLQSMKSKRRLEYVASQQRSKFSSKRHRPNNNNNNNTKSRQQAALIALNMLTRKPGNFRLIKPSTIHALQPSRLHTKS